MPAIAHTIVHVSDESKFTCCCLSSRRTPHVTLLSSTHPRLSAILSFPLPQVGLNNYSAAYATGLLLARRVLTKYGLADTYKGCEEPDGEDFNVEAAEEGPRPFYCLLDAGLKRTSTGSKTFGALKVRHAGGGGMLQQ